MPLRFNCDSILEVVVYDSFTKNDTYHISICISSLYISGPKAGLVVDVTGGVSFVN